ncbi:myxosortase-dependent M36 family metallopeptidase [Myxococcus fulvus]|uniref:myxosortase-dependent M36 family metallopeptidase n=1 Tax=Myxococcus fulvus TaxID=33 RepID=UPI003B997AD8
MRRLVAKLSGLALVLSGTGSFARTLPNYDAYLEAKPAEPKSAKLKSAAGDTSARVSQPAEGSSAPRFVWARTTDAQKSQRAKYAKMAPAAAALSQLEDYASDFGLRSFEEAGARVTSVKLLGNARLVTLTQELGGVEVFRNNVTVLLDKGNSVVGLSGALSEHVSTSPVPERLAFKGNASAAIAAAYQDVTGTRLDASLLAQVKSARPGDRYTHFSLATYARPLEEGLRVPARARPVYFAFEDRLVPAYYVEVQSGREDSLEWDAYSYVISAADGQVLMRKNMREEAAFSYRAFADTTPPYTPHDGPAGTNASPHPDGAPTGFRPAFVPPSLITLQNAPFSQNDPWLPADATVTTGNNVDAYADLVAPPRFSAGDLRPTVTAPGVFDRTMQFDMRPNINDEQIAAATTSLFFVNNWLHDWYYDSGFDEASGNAQTDNFGRGGIGGDPVLAEAQDYSGTNNANMSTPADGASPVMQMYVFNAERFATLTVTAPAEVAGNVPVGIAMDMGPQGFDLTRPAVNALDAAGPGSTDRDGCSPLTNAAEVAGNIAIIDRGGPAECSFVVKAQNAEAAGAAAVIIANNVAGAVANLGGSSRTVGIPVVLITLPDATRIRNATGLTAHLSRTATYRPDGTVDNFIVAHEWGHYISNRLVQNAAGLTNNQGRAMGEGWADFHGLLMITRPEDIQVDSNANWMGAYGPGEFATRAISLDSAFYGIRRVAYSSDMAKNALTFRHIMNGVPLPTTAPISPSASVNSQVHNSGEIWATMLWEAYTSLLRAHPFEDAQARMKRYLVTGYMLTPAAPTYSEARNALIAAAEANDPEDAQRFWVAFAKRGMGPGAISPPRGSTTHAGVVESFKVGASLEFVALTLVDDSPVGSCDRDGVLDNGETGRLVLTVINNGSVPANASTATVISPTRGITLGNGGVITIPALGSFEQATVSVPVTLTDAEPRAVAEFIVALRDPDSANPGDVVASVAATTNYSEAPETSATETVQSNILLLPWEMETAEGGGITEQYFSFTTLDTRGLNRAFLGQAAGRPTDFWLKSPELNVAATGDLIVRFDHAYQFETGANPTIYYDGAVIELTQDGGQTWVDVGTPLYGGTLNTGAGIISNLQGRQAIVGTSAGFPNLVAATLNLGTTYAGKTVQLRFRVGTDNATGTTGWAIDNIAFTGITNTPFTSLVADTGVCFNRPPVTNAGPDLTVDERTLVTVEGSGTDADGDSLTFQWTRVSGAAVTLSGATTPTVTFTAPEVAADANLVLRLTVSDGTQTTFDNVTVRVRNVNRAPTVNAGPDGSADERATVALSGTATDADNDALTYLWTQVSGTPVAIANYTTPTATFVAPEVTGDETLSFRLTVSDGKTSVNDTVNVVIHHANRAPVVTATSVSVNERSTATLTAVASDADGDTLTYAWTQLTGTPVTLDNANTATATFAAGEVASNAVLTFRVTVSDGTASVTQDVSVDVLNVNRAPTVNAGLDGTVAARATATLSGSASDEDGDTLSYTWVQTAGTAVALSAATSAVATFTAPDVSAAETLTFRLTVSDGSVIASDTVDVQVTPSPIPNQDPVAKARIIVNGPQTSLTLDGSESSDPDGDALTYKWEQTGGPSVTLNDSTRAVLSVDVPDLDGDSATFSFKLTVKDPSGASHSVTVQATAKPDEGGGCSSTGAGAPAGMIALALLSLLHRRRRVS